MCTKSHAGNKIGINGGEAWRETSSAHVLRILIRRSQNFKFGLSRHEMHVWVGQITCFCSLSLLFSAALFVIFVSHLLHHGRSQDFSKGGSHSVKQRVLAFSQPEYCRLFE